MKELVARLIGRNTKINLISATIGIVYLWFGLLKFFAGVSPAEELAKATISRLTLGFLAPEISITLTCNLGNRDRIVTNRPPF